VQVHEDDISSVLILNKKSITNQENQLFKAELEKFRPHQNRLLQANHKQSSLLKELTKVYGDLLQDKRVRSEQSKYEAFSRQRGSVMGRYRKVHQAFNDLNTGLMRAQEFYSEMKDTVNSLQQNVETFVNNRRSEGSQLLNRIDSAKASAGSAQADRESQRLKELMERMSMDPSGSPTSPPRKPPSRPSPLQNNSGFQQQQQPQQPYNPATSPPITPRYNVPSMSSGQYQQPGMQSPPAQQMYNQPGTNGSYSNLPRRESYQQNQQPYNPNTYGPVSPPAHQQYFSPPPGQYSGYQAPQQPQSQYMPPGYVPPPPPPGPPPQQDFSAISGGSYPSGPGGYAQPPARAGQQQQQQQQPPSNDPWAGLNAWK
jgi:hypothetical protein